MTPATIIRPPIPALGSPACEVTFRPLSPEEQVECLQRWSHLETHHPLPAGANDTMRRVWLTLLDYDVPLTSRELATILDVKLDIR